MTTTTTFRSTIMKLAHRFHRSGKTTWGQAQRLAWFTYRMYSSLHVRFSYRTIDGDIRFAEGGFESINTPYQYGCIKYYDVGKGAVRSFRAENFINYVH